MDNKTVACRICGNQTTMTGTKLCDRCYELESRIFGNIDLAKKIINDYEHNEDEMTKEVFNHPNMILGNTNILIP